MTELLAQFHELPAVSFAAFGLVAAAGLLMGAAVAGQGRRRAGLPR